MKAIKINHYNGVQFGYQVINNGKVIHFSWISTQELRDKIVNIINKRSK